MVVDRARGEISKQRELEDAARVLARRSHREDADAHGHRVDFRSMDWKYSFGARPYPDAAHVATFWTGLRRKVVAPVAVP